MFGIGLSELIIIGIIALLVVGPEKLPGLATKVGRFVWDIRRAWDDVRDTMRTEMMSVKQPFDEIRQAGDKARELIRNETRKITAETQKTVRAATEEVRSAAKEPVAAPAAAQPEPVAVAAAAPAAAVSEAPGAGPQPYRKPAPAPAGVTYYDLDGNPVEPTQ